MLHKIISAKILPESPQDHMVSDNNKKFWVHQSEC